MKTRFIINPRSGRKPDPRRLTAAINRFIARGRFAADIRITEARGHATALAREAIAAGCDRVVAVGGDGTVNEVAQALIGTGATLAIIPCGSGNGLALHLGIPTAPPAALALLDGGRRVAIDTGRANGHVFCNVMGLGFDAEISRRFNHLVRRGLLAYAVIGLRTLWRHRPEPVLLAAEGRTLEVDAFMVALANSDQYGNHARVAPGACIHDGVLDLIVVRTVDLLSAAVLAARLFHGSFDHSSRVMRLRGERFTLTRPAPGIIHTDGEVHETGARVEVAVRAGSLQITVPSERFERDRRPEDGVAEPRAAEIEASSLSGPAATEAGRSDRLARGG